MRHALLITVLVLISCTSALAQRGAVAGRINLPWQVPDINGNTWVVYQQGFLRQHGNMQLYAQAAMLTINGNTPSAAGNQASLDPKTGELVLEALNVRAGLSVTRRVQVNRNESYVRYIDIFRNTTPADQTLPVQYSSNFNFQPNSVQFIEDPRGKERMLGAAVMSDMGRSVYEIYAGRGAKVWPQFMSQPNSNQVQASMQLVIPGNKQVALVHVHGMTIGGEGPDRMILSMKDSKLLSDVPLELRRTILNTSAVASVGDREVLRGDLLDVIELRDGDQLKGTLTEGSYKLESFYGAMELPADRVVAVMNVGAFRPRQLVVTSDGEVFGGSLARESIGIQLSSGQTLNVPLGQISRIGYRKRVGEPEEWVFDKPWVSLRSGDRLFVEVPTEPIEVMTRFGMLKLPPTAIAAILLESSEHAVHEVLLSDGSRFAALVPSPSYGFQLSGAATAQRVTLPVAMIEQIRLNPKEVELDESAAVLKLTSGDEFVGMLQGQHQLDTRFDTIALSGPELRSLERDPAAGLDVQVVLWDQTTIGGQLREPMLKYNLSSGVEIAVPLALVQSYSNPLPQASSAMVTRIKAIVAQLSADDWKTREQAEAQLVALGPSIIAVLKEMSGKVPPEAQQRIDAILIQLQAMLEPLTPAGPAAPVRGRGR